jgi:hypothetical protein
MIGRADIEGSKSDVAMDAWPPQASYPCGNFSDTSCWKLYNSKGSISHAFAVRIRTENQDQVSIYLFALREVSVLSELALGHLRYALTDVPPQSNSPPDTVIGAGRQATEWHRLNTKMDTHAGALPFYRLSKESMKVVVFHWRLRSHLCYTSHDSSQSQTRVKLNRVFFPR